MKSSVSAALTVACLGLTSLAHAAVFNVDRNDDPSPGTASACSNATPNDCSLRGAIQKANQSLGVADVINVPASAVPYVLGIAGDLTPNDNLDGDLDILDAVTIVGAGAASTVIDAAHLDRIFDVSVGANVEVNISGLKLINGKALTSLTGSPEAGGAIVVDAGVVELAALVLQDNQAGDGNLVVGVGGCGGGLAVLDGEVTLEASHVLDNLSGEASVVAVVPALAGAAGGGVCLVDGALDVVDTTISGNATSDGLTLSLPLVGSVGGAGGSGGGIAVLGGSVTVTSSTITANVTGDAGVSADSIGLPGAVGASGGLGGGIAFGGGSLSLNNVTVTGNLTGNGALGGLGSVVGLPGLGGSGGGVARLIGAVGPITISNSIIADNAVGVSINLGLGLDCFGAVTSAGGNLLKSALDCVGLVDGVNADLVGLDAGLDVSGLLDHGGLTLTIGLDVGSLAIDAGVGVNCDLFDQRGSIRLDGDGDGLIVCDIGAVEFERCGDGVEQDGEECDDGNETDGDGCSADCTDEDGGATAGGTTGGATAGEATAGGDTGGATSGENTGGEGSDGDGIDLAGDGDGPSSGSNASGGCSLIR